MILRESRKQHAAQLAEDISLTIRQLGMPKGFITADFMPVDKMQAHGLDKIEYKVCTNPGMAPDTLAKIASGGELSRISLAIQMIAAKRGATPTLLFDEVDVGIGGRSRHYQNLLPILPAGHVTNMQSDMPSSFGYAEVTQGSLSPHTIRTV